MAVTQEWGVFTPEGCVERQLWSQDAAEGAAQDYRVDGAEGVTAELLCPEHADEEQPLDGCEECAQEDNS